MSEFTTAVYYRYYLELECDSELVSVTNTKHACINKDVILKPVSNGSAMTSLGPAPYMGDILENPDILWTEDIWTESRKADAKQRILEQGANVSSFWKTKYENKAGAYWHDFYLRNTDKFYKDRHYLHVVFPELINDWRTGSYGYTNDKIDYSALPLNLLEVGCGVGNAVLPLLTLNPLLKITAIDFAKSAIEILKKHPAVLETERLFPFARCIVRDELPVTLGTMDLVLCMFVLSAIGPEYQLEALLKITGALRVGGKLLIRDYGRFVSSIASVVLLIVFSLRYDEAQLRFKKGSKLGDDFYVRQDGTCAFFFELEQLKTLCAKAGLRCDENEYIMRQYANRQQKAARYRVWIHAKFTKL
jgi:2-polyprenyl-3-methyl-5-hydroxy-6-metoxy-1,4-benzoquinol methylase